MNRTTIPAIVIIALTLVGAGCFGSAPSSSPSGSVAPAPSSASVRLDLSGKGLTSVPKDVFERTDLEELDLSDNRLTGALPAEIRQLRSLRALDASGNKMTGVPAEIGQLSALVTLDLSDNELTGLPLELGNLKNLKTLDLRGNDVSPQDVASIRSAIPYADILVD